jgi:hypothetical protein
MDGEKTERADGTVAVTWLDEGQVEAALKAKAGVTAQLGQHEVGLRGEAAVAATLLADAGDTAVFTSREDADSYLRDRLVTEGIDRLPAVARHLARGGRWVIDRLTGHEPPTPDSSSTHAQVGVKIGGTVKGTAGPVGAEVKAAVQGAVATKADDDGSSTVTVLLDVEGGGKAGVPALVLLQEAVGSTASATLSFDPAGELTAVRLTGVAEHGGGLTLVGQDTNLDDILKSVKLSGSGEETARVVVDLELDVGADSAARRAVLDFLASAPRVGGPSIEDVVALGASTTDLLGHLRDQAKVGVRAYEDTRTAFGLDAEVRLGLGLGGKGELAMTESQLVGAALLDRDRGEFVPWTTCTGGG